MAGHDIIVMGASYGGIKAYLRLVSLLPKDLRASVFIVQHTSPHADSILDLILSQNGSLPAIKAEDGMRFEPGAIYVARPNYHLLVKERHIKLSFGPRENRVRPSIDALFRSAAAYHTTRVIGVLLTGLLDDGVSGLAAIKICGGIAVVQHPEEAEAPAMPINAINDVDIDHILTLKQIAEKLPGLVLQESGKPVPVPEEIMDEVKIAEHTIPDLETMDKIGKAP